jgi:hypothetical protein
MRWLTLWIVLLGLALPAFAADPATVKDLERIVARARGKPDAHVARQISGMQLTERLSTARLTKLKSALPGEEARSALLVVADASAFLTPPADEIPANEAPDRAAQQAMLSRTVRYLTQTIPMLPDFLATQDTVQFSDGPMRTSPLTGRISWNSKIHAVANSSTAVRFVADKGDVQGQGRSGAGLAPAGAQLTVEGVFGPIFGVVLKDALGSSPRWSHWEQGTPGPMAVFHYEVVQERSHYLLQYFTVYGIQDRVTAYRGEISLDPATGAILRVTMLAMLPPRDSITEADILVEYGPVELGGKTYICPSRSVALSKSRDTNPVDGGFAIPGSVEPPLKIELSDVSYQQYHLFRTQVRMLPPDASDPSAVPPQAIPPAPNR